MADFDANRLQDESGNNLNFVPTNFMDAQGNSKPIEVEFGKKQNTLSLEADSADISDNMTIVKTLNGAKLKTALAVKFWNYIKGKLGFNSSTNKYGISISGSADSAGKLNASAGGPSQPVYFPSSGIPTEIPLTELPANSGEHYLTIQVQGAYYATNAGTASKLSNTSAIGSGNQPVYFTANGVPVAIPYDQSNPNYLTLAVLTAKEAGSAVSAGKAGKLSNTSAIGSGNQPVYFTANGVPVAIPYDQSNPNYLTLAVLTAKEAGSAVSAGKADKLSNTSAIGSGNQPVYFTANGVPAVIPTETVTIGGQQTPVLTLAVYTAYAAEQANSAATATGANKLNLGAAVGSGNQPVYFTANGVPAVIPTQQVSIGGQQVPVLTLAVQTAYAAEQANSASNASGANKLNLNAAVGSGNQPVYFTANGVPEVIPTQQVSIGGQQVAVLTLAVQTAFASEKATKDSDGNQINTTYLRKDVAEATYSRIVNVRSIEDHTYNLSGEDTDVTAFAINFAGYDSLPMNRPTMLLISLQYECAGGTALGLKFKYGTTALGATSLPDGRHYVTLPVVWQAKHNVLDPNPFSLCFCGVSGKSVHVMSGSLVLM